MNPQGAQNYLRTKVLTATPEQLQMMLYDGAIRFGEQAKIALGNKKFDESYTLISKVQKIVMELSCSLKHAVLPDLCQKLQALYTYAYKKLIEANIDHKMESLEEALSILRYQRRDVGAADGKAGETEGGGGGDEAGYAGAGCADGSVDIDEGVTQRRGHQRKKRETFSVVRRSISFLSLLRTLAITSAT